MESKKKGRQITIVMLGTNEEKKQIIGHTILSHPLHAYSSLIGIKLQKITKPTSFFSPLPLSPSPSSPPSALSRSFSSPSNLFASPHETIHLVHTPANIKKRKNGEINIKEVVKYLQVFFCFCLIFYFYIKKNSPLIEI